MQVIFSKQPGNVLSLFNYFVPAGCIILALILSACPGPDHPQGKDAAAVPDASGDSSVHLSGEQPPATNDTSVVTHVATVRTSFGSFTIELFGNETPKTVNNFINLARRGKYNRVLFHRVARNFVIQTGDPKTRYPGKRDEWGTGGESSYGKPFEDELDPGSPAYRKGYVRGAVAMANSGPGTNTSQFFICLEDIPDLPRDFTIFGRVSDGMPVVDSIGTVEIEPVLDTTDGIPVDPVVIKSVRISARRHKK